METALTVAIPDNFNLEEYKKAEKKMIACMKEEEAILKRFLKRNCCIEEHTWFLKIRIALEKELKRYPTEQELVFKMKEQPFVINKRLKKNYPWLFKIPK